MRIILWLYAILAAALVVLVLRAEPAGAESQPAPAPRLLVLGDSISGGQDHQEPWAWFNAASTDHELTRYSFPGTGFAQKPRSCALAFHSRWHLIGDTRPDTMIVEDAVGAIGWCSPSTYYTQSRSQVFTNVDNSMRELALEWSRNGNTDRSKVVIMVIRSHKMKGFDWVGDRIAQRAAIHGFTMIRPYLTVNQTTDGVHPNQAGHDVLTAAATGAI